MFGASLVSFGLYSALIPRRPKIHQLSLISFTTCCGALMLLPVAIWEFANGVTLKLDLLTFATLGYTLIFPSTLAYLFFNRGVALIGPNRAAPFFHLVPVFGSAMAILLLGETLAPFHLIGYALVLAGVDHRLAAGVGERTCKELATPSRRRDRPVPLHPLDGCATGNGNGLRGRLLRLSVTKSMKLLTFAGT